MGGGVPAAADGRRESGAQPARGVPARRGVVLERPRLDGARIGPADPLRPGLARPAARAYHAGGGVEPGGAGDPFARGPIPPPPPPPPPGPPPRRPAAPCPLAH